jgi:putative Mg2+ transporter-C (MgtC) family protein
MWKNKLDITLLLNIIKLLVTILSIYLITLTFQKNNGPIHAISLILIGVGSCIFMMTAVTLSPLVITEPQQIAGNVMVGMLILGIIVLLKNKITLKSAVSVILIWISGAIGLAIGSGLFLEGIFVAFFTYILLNLLVKNIQSDL